jgi:hypothetical protein
LLPGSDGAEQERHRVGVSGEKWPKQSVYIWINE